MTNREYAEKLIRLMQEHPDLPVVPKVSGDGIVSDDCFAWWTASLGDCQVEKWIVYNDRLYSYDDAIDILDCLYDDGLIKGNDDDPWTQEDIDSLPWKEVIAVTIDTPEEDFPDAKEYFRKSEQGNAQ